MTDSTVTTSAAPVLERRTIDMVPESERTGSARNQFTLWLGGNLQITAVVTGALAVVFGAGATSAIIGLLVGNIVGGAVMALHSAQGPRLGLPQMISSRVQFGVRGAALPLVLVVLMYLGFAATGAILAGQSIDLLLHIKSQTVGILIFGVLTAVVAMFGYKLIHIMGRIASVVGILGFGYLLIRLISQGHISSGPSFSGVTFLTAIGLSAGWQMTYAPYVADYSRYLPSSTPIRATFWSTFAGSVIGTQISMVFGVLLASSSKGAFMDSQVAYLGKLAGPAFAAFLIYLVILVGKVTVNCLNAYGGFMSILTAVSGFNNTRQISQRARSLYIIGFVAISVVIALAASANFLQDFKNFVLVLLSVFIPWSVINLVDYYLISKEKVDIPALYDPKGRYGSVNWVAMISYVVGTVVQIPFLSQTLYTGPIAKALKGADISWLVGSIVTFAIYYVWAKRTMNPPDQMIYPDDHAVDLEPSAA